MLMFWGLGLLVVAGAVVGETLDTVLVDEYSEFWASTDVVDVIQGEQTSITFTLRGHVTEPFNVHIFAEKSVSLSRHHLHFGKQLSNSVNVSGVHPSGRSLVRIDRCSPGPCPFKTSSVFATITVLRSRLIAFLVPAIGWIYFIAWSVSFYPQIALNYKRRSVDGLNSDFVILSTLGFAAYSAFNVIMYTSSHVQHIYLNANPGATIPVLSTDVFFSLHALAACTVLLVQSIVYSRGLPSVTWLWSLVSLILSLICVVALVASAFDLLNWLQFINVMSLVKLFISLVKYLPQLILNMRRRDTSGWSLGYALLDISGASLVLVQLLLQAINTNDWNVFIGNPVKFGLAFKSIVFDIVFVYQHYAYGGAARVHDQELVRTKVVLKPA